MRLTFVLILFDIFVCDSFSVLSNIEFGMTSITLDNMSYVIERNLRKL